MHCRLLISGLPFGSAGFVEQTQQRRYPALELLLARGRRSERAFESHEQWLLETFSVDRQEDWPSAPFALLGEGIAPGDGYWLHADPVHLHADRDHVLLADGAELELSQEEATQLARTVETHFGEALKLHLAHPRRWYARPAAPPAGRTLALREVAGRTVEASTLAIGWYALMNEIQMLLHEHPVNERREQRGAPAINGLWLWGGGRLVAAKADRLHEVAGDDPLATGLARAAGIASAPLPAGAGAWLERSPEEGVHLVVLNRSSRPADPEASALDTLERQWAAPLVGALQSGRVGMVTLHFENGERMMEVETTQADLRRLWRLRRNLSHYLKS